MDTASTIDQPRDVNISMHFHARQAVLDLQNFSQTSSPPTDIGHRYYFVH